MAAASDGVMSMPLVAWATVLLDTIAPRARGPERRFRALGEQRVDDHAGDVRCAHCPQAGKHTGERVA